MTYTIIQNSFQFGEISPLLRARVDMPFYFRGVKRLRNCVVIPQGGAERRFGTVYVDQINNHAGPPVYNTDYTEVKPFIFDYENGDRYLLIFRNNAIDVYFNNLYQTTTVTTYAAAEIKYLSVAQSQRIVFIAHPDHQPATLIKTSVDPAPIALTLNATPTFVNYPTFDFAQNYDAYTFNVQVGGVNIVTAQNTLGRAVTIISSTAMFTDDYNGGLFFSEGGVIRLGAKVGGVSPATTINGRIIKIFDAESSLFNAPNTILGDDALVTEKAFSTNRGWPHKVSFFQNRLFFGRTDSLAGGIWGSNYNGYSATKFNFDDSESLDTNAISTVLQGGKSTLIEHMVAFKTLLVFTTGGLYSTPLLIELPLVPTNMAFVNLQTSDASNNVTPLIFDNDVIFFDKGGKKVKSVNVFATTQHYETKNISVLAPHLVDSPYSAAVYENSSTKDGNWLLMINNGDTRDGQLAVYQNVPEQDIAAWSLSTAAPTDDGAEESFFRHVVSDEEDTYFIVERVVNGNTRLFIEQLRWDVYTDATLVTAPTVVPGTTVTGLGYLEGEVVQVRGDGGVMAENTVVGGQITLEYEVSEVDIGLGFNPEIVPLQMNVNLSNGNSLYRPKTIKNMDIDFYESSGIEVDGTLIPPFRINYDQYNQPPNPQTDFVKVQPMAGWDPAVEITIGQSSPMPMTIIGISFVVSI
jgi:hypothetical protein